MNICTGDLGGTAAKKLDVEVWYPGQKRFREVASYVLIVPIINARD